MQYQGLGGGVRCESGEFHKILDTAFNAGRDAAISGVFKGYTSVQSQDYRREFKHGWESIRPWGERLNRSR